MAETEKRTRRYLYIVIIICCCGIQISQAGIANCMGLFYHPMLEEFGTTMAGISATQTVKMMLSGVVGLFVASLYSRLGMRTCVITGCTFVFAATLCQGFAKNLTQLMICAVLVGIAKGLMGTFLIKMVILNWFEEKQGTAFGLAACSSGIFGAVFNPVVSKLIIDIGWRKAMFVLAFIALACMVPAMLFMRLTPAEYGMRPYGQSADRAEAGREDSTQSGEGGSPAKKGKLHIGWEFVLTVCLGYLTGICAPLMSHMASYAETSGFDPETAAFMVSAMMLGNLFFKLVLGALCDRIGALRTSLLGYCTILAAVLLFLFGKGTFCAVLGSFLYGICFGLSIVAVTQYTNRLFPKNDYGRYYSLYLFFTQSLGSLNGTLAGLMYDVTGSYTSVLRLSIVFIVAAAVLLLVLEKMTRKKEMAQSRLEPGGAV